MLVLTRKVEESILIGDDIEIKVLLVKGTGKGASVRVGIVAPDGVRVLRKEVLLETAEENRRAALSESPDFSQILPPEQKEGTRRGKRPQIPAIDSISEKSARS